MGMGIGGWWVNKWGVVQWVVLVVNAVNVFRAEPVKSESRIGRGPIMAFCSRDSPLRFWWIVMKAARIIPREQNCAFSRNP